MPLTHDRLMTGELLQHRSFGPYGAFFCVTVKHRPTKDLFERWMHSDKNCIKHPRPGIHRVGDMGES